VNRANDGQDQALQTHRAPLREDGNKLCLIPRPRLRLHLDQIRPHGLGSFADLLMVNPLKEAKFRNTTDALLRLPQAI
jgi:hypothetical protein